MQLRAVLGLALLDGVARSGVRMDQAVCSWLWLLELAWSVTWVYQHCTVLVIWRLLARRCIVWRWFICLYLIFCNDTTTIAKGAPISFTSYWVSCLLHLMPYLEMRHGL